MKCMRATGTVAVFLLLGTIAPAYAQHGQQDEKQGKPEKDQGKHPQGAPPAAQPQRSKGQREQPQERRGQAAQPQRQRAPDAPQPRPQQQRAQDVRQPRPQQQEQRAQQARPQPQPYRSPQQVVTWQQQRGWIQQGAWREHSTWQEGRARQWESEHRTWAQRGGYGGYYIPPSRFSLYFGRQHWFRMRSRPTMFMGYPRFSNNGFSFLLVDPWPEYWADNWYASDDVYVDYDDGYYLYNRRYPAIRLAITVIQ